MKRNISVRASLFSRCSSKNICSCGHFIDIYSIKKYSINMIQFYNIYVKTNCMANKAKRTNWKKN